MTNVILTNNAKRRIHEDNLSQGIITDAIQNADRSFPGREPGISQFQKQRDFGTVTVIAKKTYKGDWLIISCGLKRPYGSSPRPSAYPNNPSLLERILQALLGKFQSKAKK
jgi:hypothetical protein